MVIERACGRLGWDLAGLRCVVQGFGNVGGIAATELHEKGATVIAVSDVSGGVHDPDGLDIPTLHEHVREHGSLEGFDGGTRVTNAELLELECDVLVLAAREDQVTVENAGNSTAGWSSRARTARPRSRPTRSSPSAGFRCCPTCSRTPAASPSRTSSGCRTSAASSGTATRSARGSRTSSATRSIASGRSPRSDGLSLRDAALVAGIREVSAALEARGLYP